MTEPLKPPGAAALEAGTKVICSVKMGWQTWAGGEVGWVVEANDTDYRVRLHPCGMTGWVEHKYVEPYDFVERDYNGCQG